MNRSRLLKDKRRGKGPLRNPFVLTFAAAAVVPAAAALATSSACTESKPAPTNGSPLPPNNNEGPCSPQGATRSCHTSLGLQDGIQLCFQGTQACIGGAWSACGGSGVVSGQNVSAQRGGLRSADLGSGSNFGGLRTESLSDASADAAVCLADPCNPYCVGYEEDAGTGITPEGGTTIVGTTGFGDIKKKERDDLFQDQNHSFGAFCDYYPTGGSSTSNLSFFACQLDTYCDLATTGGTGLCTQFPTPGEYPTTPTAPFTGTAVAVDLTIAAPCTNGGGSAYDSVPVCNRGNADLAPPGNITIWIGGSPPVTTCPPVGATPDCTTPIPAAGIPAGQCILVDFAAACGAVPKKKTFLYVNADNSIPEATLVPDPATGQANQPGCANNYGAMDGIGNNPPACQSGSSAAQPLVYTQTYVGDCSGYPGAHVQWGLLTYDTFVPSDTSGSAAVEFEVQTAPILEDGGPGAPSGFVSVADVNANLDPQVCNLSGPAVWKNCSDGIKGPKPPCCPKDIGAALQASTTATPPGLGDAGWPALSNGQLTLQVTLTPAPDGKAVPTLYHWEISYSCVPSE